MSNRVHNLALVYSSLLLDYLITPSVRYFFQFNDLDGTFYLYFSFPFLSSP